MKQYLDLMRRAHDEGAVKTDRTGTGTRSVFGHQMRFNLQEGFPLLTTKKVHLRAIIHELIWFLAGDTNIKYLLDNDVHIWDEWADADGNLGPIYGYQWRSWPGPTYAATQPRNPADKVSMYLRLDGEHSPDWKVYQESIDQITQVLDQIKNNPDSRRMIVSAWNPTDIPSMKLPPCHALFQFYTRELTKKQRIDYALSDPHLRTLIDVDERPLVDSEEMMPFMDSIGVPTRYLDCQLYQRSADIFLGVPFNIASYAILTHMLAQQANMLPGEFIWTGGDCHLYSNHMEQVGLQLSRDIRALPQLVIKRKPDSIFDYKIEDFEVRGYDPHAAIKAEVAV